MPRMNRPLTICLIPPFLKNIMRSDEISGLLLSELGVSSVTASGVRHAPGEVIGGESVGEVARLSAKVDWDRAACAEKEGERALEACAKGCR